tara:strand:+ start:227 stop:883 length:657 start_codon:yes stop_codon:yes gene_type:complete
MAFSTAADVESYTQINFDSALETHLTNNIIPFVDAAINQYVGYELEYGTKTETFTGDQTREIFLRHLPVRSITSVVEDDTTLTQGNSADYVFYDSGRLRRLGKRWSYAKEQNIVVTYVAGYTAFGGGVSTDLPIQIKMVSSRAAARMLEATISVSSQQEPGEISAQGSSTAGNFNLAVSERIGDYSADYSIGLDALSLSPLTASDMSLLSPYRKSYFV